MSGSGSSTTSGSSCDTLWPMAESAVSARRRVGTVLLWSALVLVGTMFGASVYQRVSLIPEWGGALPQSVPLYFKDPRAGQAIDRFWTLVTAPTALTIVLSLALNWPSVVRRRWISTGAVLFF